MKHGTRLAVSAAAFFALWLVIVGTNAGWEELAGGGAAIVAGLFGLAVARTRSRRIDLQLDAARLARALQAIVRESGLIVLALVRRRRGRFRTVASRLGGANPAVAGRRAFATFAGTLAPNTYIVDIDPETGRQLVHDLDARRAGETP